MDTEGNVSDAYRESKYGLRQWLHHQTFEFYEARINALIRRWNIAIEREEIMLRSRNVNLFCIDIS